jgi:hypothetical protein
MSQAPPSHESINVSNAGKDMKKLLCPCHSHLLHLLKDHYPPQFAQREAPHGVSSFVEGSGPIFSMYSEMATEEDKKMAENWKADADGILIFVRHF